MKISYVNSVCVRNDAISNAIRDEFGFLRSAGHDIRLYAFSCDDPTLPYTRCLSVSDVVSDRHFLDSDLVVFHFGIYYTLFNVFPVIPKRVRKVVVFHNVTPASLVAPKDQWLIEKSLAQIDNMRWADHVICDSTTNLGVLQSYGVTTPASVLPLAVHTALQAPASKPSFKDETVRIAFVGRFTKSKGPLELLDAVESVMHEGVPSRRIQLDFIGNLDFSDPAIVATMQQRREEIVRMFPDKLAVQIHGSAPDEIKHVVLREADVFALPTYHEGFCVPIIEAIASGCRVVVYDNSNTPDISGELGTLVPTGDVRALGGALRSVIDEVCSQVWRDGHAMQNYARYVQAGMRHVQRFSPDRVAPAFVRTIHQVIAR